MFWIQPLQPQPSYPPCPFCGAAIQTIAKTERVGCAQCYTHYRQLLTPYIRRIHGQASHIGRAPSTDGAMIALKKKQAELETRLAAAIVEQDFETCAALRDEINALKEGGK